MRQGQITIEFLVILAAFSVLFLALLNVAHTYTDSAQEAYEGASATVVLENIGGTFNALVLAGNGSSASVLLPNTLDGGESYELELIADAMLLELRWPLDVAKAERTRVQFPLLTGAFSGSLPSPGQSAAAQYSEGVVRLA